MHKKLFVPLILAINFSSSEMAISMQLNEEDKMPSKVLLKNSSVSGMQNEIELAMKHLTTHAELRSLHAEPVTGGSLRLLRIGDISDFTEYQEKVNAVKKIGEYKGRKHNLVNPRVINELCGACELALVNISYLCEYSNYQKSSQTSSLVSKRTPMNMVYSTSGDKQDFQNPEGQNKSQFSRFVRRRGTNSGVESKKMPTSDYPSQNNAGTEEGKRKHINWRIEPYDISKASYRQKGVCDEICAALCIGIFCPRKHN